jgi:hypothetical protein
MADINKNWWELPSAETDVVEPSRFTYDFDPTTTAQAQMGQELVPPGTFGTPPAMTPPPVDPTMGPPPPDDGGRTALYDRLQAKKAEREGRSLEETTRRAQVANALFSGVAGAGDVIAGKYGRSLPLYERLAEKIGRPLAERGAQREAATKAKAKMMEKAPSVQDLRKEYTANPIVRDTGKIATAVSRMSSAWDEYQRNPDKKKLIALDQALVVTFNKMLDPGSVVRESEFARTPEGQAAIDKMQGWYERLETGGVGLVKESREEIMAVANQLLDGQLAEYRKVKDQFTNEANIYEYDPKRIVVDYKPQRAGKSAPVTQKTQPKAIPTDEDIDKMSEEELKKYLGVK